MINFWVMTMVCAPLLGAIGVGLSARRIAHAWAHSITCVGVALSFGAACVLFYHQLIQGLPSIHADVYTWAISGRYHFVLGYWMDHLTAIMCLVVTFVSLLVHIYSIGYMKNDPGYPRFFAYMSLFTFAMLLLVVAHNFLQLFIGWEGVGVVSYLLIGFWFNKPSAASGSFKAFVVNRVGDFGFILGLAALMEYVGSLDYSRVFVQAHSLSLQTLTIAPFFHFNLLTAICIFLFIGAMAKSAQIPLHVWLPESMEGPTPISALIHAATMVTAGVYMVARLSPLFSLSQVALSTVLIIGATGALLLGLLALVENDIKRIIAYSTMSQLGYMMAANGVAAYPCAMFHLFTHACFKALLFLSAGSVIIAMHHEQSIQKMGGLARKLPITYVCFLVGSLALAGFPPFSGFFSKEAIIEAVHLSTITGSSYAYICLLLGVLVTALYTFRMFFLTFHGQTRMEENDYIGMVEPGFAVTFPLLALAVPSLLLGIVWAKPLIYQAKPWLAHALTLPSNEVMTTLASSFHGEWLLIMHGISAPPFGFALLGIGLAWLFYCRGYVYSSFPAIRERITRVLLAGYGFDSFNNFFFVKGIRRLSDVMYQKADMRLIDDGMVNASGQWVVRVSKLLSRIQTGFVFHYIFVMVLALLVFLLIVIKVL